MTTDVFLAMARPLLSHQLLPILVSGKRTFRGRAIRGVDCRNFAQSSSAVSYACSARTRLARRRANAGVAEWQTGSSWCIGSAATCVTMGAHLGPSVASSSDRLAWSCGGRGPARDHRGGSLRAAVDLVLDRLRQLGLRGEQRVSNTGCWSRARGSTGSGSSPRRPVRQGTASDSRKARFPAGASWATRAAPFRPRSSRHTPSAAAPWASG